MRTTIWIPDDIVGEMKDEAWRRRVSLSKYLVDLHLRNKGYREGVKSPADSAVYFKPMPKGGKR